MIRVSRFVGLVLGLAVAGAHAERLAGQAFPDCQARVAEDPTGRDGYWCVYEQGVSGAAGRASVELEALAAAHPEVGWPLHYLASLHWGEPEVGERYLSQAIERFARSADPRGEAFARGNRQQLLYRLGRLEEAERDAELAAELGQSSGDPEALAWGRMVLARHLLSTSSDLDRAYAILEGSERDLTADLPYFIRRDTVANLARVALEIGRAGEAREAFDRLLVLASEAGDQFSQATAWYGLTRILVAELAETPQPELRSRAVEAARRTLEAARGSGRTDIEGKAHWVLGVIGPSAEAADHFARCGESVQTPRDRSYCLDGLARARAATDPQGARELVRDALSLAESGGDPLSEALAWQARMRVSWAAEPVDRAVADSWSALDRIEALRDLQDDGSNVQAGMFSGWADDYHWFAGRLLVEARDSGRADLVAQAFAVSERLRARALTDWLQATGQTPSGASRPGFASLPQVQGALRPREALLVFQVAPWEDLAGDFGGGSWLIAVTRDSVWAYPLPGRQEIRRLVHLYTGLFDGRDGSEGSSSAYLYRELLGPALAGLPAGTDRLVLVPDDALHRLPFGALRPEAEGPPLATSHRLSVAPSASLWLGWRRHRAGAQVARASSDPADRAPALVLAAPSVSGNRKGAPPPVAAPSSTGAIADLPPLRHARREGRAVAAALGRGTDLALGPAASEALLGRADLGRFGVLHLAAHAVTDEGHPERSAVVLAATATGDGAAPETDGFLQAGEIASLDLGGKLVVLSSCRSAAGTVLRGEGVMSLGRAFFQAGARTVVASLWPVRDDEAAVLFESFYRHLARGESVSTALQAAQAERIAAGDPASAWAAFVVLGDGELAPVKPPPPPSPELRFAYLAGALGAALLLALAAVLLRRRIANALAARRPRRRRLTDLASASSSTR